MNPFAKLNKQYIGGTWRDGSSEKVLSDRNPYNGAPIADFKLATLVDLDEAYRSAAAAQKVWAEINPFERRAILERAVTYIEKVEADITAIIIDELGGTRLKSFFEIGLVKNIIKEAATYPLRMTGEILPSVMDGKENRLYRVPVGVVGVISPFNFPFILSMRSVAAALGAGNGVVLKPHDDSAIVGGTLVAKVFESAGLPKGLLNVIVADHRENRRRLPRAPCSAGYFLYRFGRRRPPRWFGCRKMPEKGGPGAWRKQCAHCHGRCGSEPSHQRSGIQPVYTSGADLHVLQPRLGS